MSPEQRGQIDSANAMKPTNFTTPHGSQNVDNSNYAVYTDSYPDLVSNYNANWRDKGVSKAEFGAMHWNKSGRSEGRSMPGVSSGSGSGESGGSSGSSGSSGLLDSNIGPYPRPNKYFPLLTQAYDRPQARDYSEFIQAGNPFGGNGGLLYQPYSQQYSERYGLPNEIAQYQPNIFGVGDVSYYGTPFGPLNILAPEELYWGDEEEEEEGNDDKNQGGAESTGPGASVGTAATGESNTDPSVP